MGILRSVLFVVRKALFSAVFAGNDLAMNMFHMLEARAIAVAKHEAHKALLIAVQSSNMGLIAAKAQFDRTKAQVEKGYNLELD